LFASGNLRKYQDESTKVSSVSVSLLAGPPQQGHFTFTHSEREARGEPFPTKDISERLND
jgi:hypothetical protein